MSHQEDRRTATFARSPVGGKRNSKAEARITDEVKEDLRRRCAELGMTEPDYIDRLICVSLYGIDHVLSIEQARTRMVCGLSVGERRNDGVESAQ